MKKIGVARIDERPLFAMCGITPDRKGQPIFRGPLYEYEELTALNKLRRRLSSAAYGRTIRRLAEKKDPRRIGLGVVGRMVPEKCFACLFKYIAPILADCPNIYVDIFGPVRYSYIDELSKSLTPIRRKVNFWGYQKNVAAIYPRIDYLLTGFPKNEGFALNILEAQYFGVPTVAIEEQPFTEIIRNGSNGLLYRNPLLDEGADFRRVADVIANRDFKIDEQYIGRQCEKYSADAFRQRKELQKLSCLM